jgi:hypothetical protein
MKPSLWEVIMSYATLMVHLDLDQKNDARLRVVGDLADRFTTDPRINCASRR